MTTTTATPVTAPGMPERGRDPHPGAGRHAPRRRRHPRAWSPSTTGIDHTRPNTFGPQTIAGLQATVDGLRARAEAGEIQAVGITGKPFVFAVGADLSGVALRRPSASRPWPSPGPGHAAFASIMDLPVPTFAFVNGAAMGGGVEIALACDYRTISYGVPAFALPETFLGLVPGWGGCYLLPNLVGAANALKVIIENPLSQNRMLKAKEVAALGIADVAARAGRLPRGLAALGRRRRSPAPSPCERREVDRDEAAWDAASTPRGRSCSPRPAAAAPGALRAVELVAPRAPRAATRPSPPRTTRSAT